MWAAQILIADMKLELTTAISARARVNVLLGVERVEIALAVRSRCGIDDALRRIGSWCWRLPARSLRW